jgi:hypothetical protein
LNPNETQLAPTNVQVGTFDKLFVTAVDGQVYAEPLVNTGIMSHVWDDFARRNWDKLSKI